VSLSDAIEVEGEGTIVGTTPIGEGASTGRRIGLDALASYTRLFTACADQLSTERPVGHGLVGTAQRLFAEVLRTGIVVITDDRSRTFGIALPVFVTGLALEADEGFLAGAIDRSRSVAAEPFGAAGERTGVYIGDAYDLFVQTSRRVRIRIVWIAGVGHAIAHGAAERVERFVDATPTVITEVGGTAETISADQRLAWEAVSILAGLRAVARTAIIAVRRFIAGIGVDTSVLISLFMVGDTDAGSAIRGGRTTVVVRFVTAELEVLVTGVVGAQEVVGAVTGRCLVGGALASTALPIRKTERLLIGFACGSIDRTCDAPRFRIGLRIVRRADRLQAGFVYNQRATWRVIELMLARSVVFAGVGRTFEAIVTLLVSRTPLDVLVGVTVGVAVGLDITIGVRVTIATPPRTSAKGQDETHQKSLGKHEVMVPRSPAGLGINPVSAT